jgi:hypothetical protein
MTSTLLGRAAPRHRPLLFFVCAMAGLAVVAAAGIVLDDRVVTGAPVWLKPFKFAVSFVLYAGTLAWLLTLLPRRSRPAEWAATVIVAVSVVEMAIIVSQVLRGRASHFNEATALDAALWETMAAAIMVLFAAHFVIGYVLLRARIADRTVRYAVALGLGLSLLGMLAAVPMVVPSAESAAAGVVGAHSVGVPDGGPGLPLVGWSTTGGDLRVGHFVGLHALQALPLLALLLHRMRHRWDEATLARLVLVAGAAYGLLTVLLTAQALRGQALLRPDAVTLGGFALLVTGTVLATRAVLAARPLPATRAVPATRARAAAARDGMLVR